MLKHIVIVLCSFSMISYSCGFAFLGVLHEWGCLCLTGFACNILYLLQMPFQSADLWWGFFACVAMFSPGKQPRDFGKGTTCVVRHLGEVLVVLRRSRTALGVRCITTIRSGRGYRHGHKCMGLIIYLLFSLIMMAVTGPGMGGRKV